MPYAELVSTSNFTFLRGGSHPGELVQQAAALGLSGIGICDRNSLAGVVRGHIAAREVWKSDPAFRYLVGARLVFSDDTPNIAVYPTDRAAYGRLCALLTTGNRRAVKGECILRFDDLREFSAGQLFIVLDDRDPTEPGGFDPRELAVIAPGRVWLGIAATYGGIDKRRFNKLAWASQQTGIPMIAVNDVIYHHPERRMLQMF